MHYANIKYCDISNGPGVRTSLFVSGCTHHCKGCFNHETWDFNYGQPFTADTRKAILKSLIPDYISGLTLLGGEPLDPSNQIALSDLLNEIKKKYPQKNIWCYTGYLYEDLTPGGRAFCSVTQNILSCIDVLVDGPFIENKKDLSLKFRGSSNQRIIYL